MSAIPVFVGTDVRRLDTIPDLRSACPSVVPVEIIFDEP